MGVKDRREKPTLAPIKTSPPDDPLRPETLLGRDVGELRLTAVLGSGSFAVVFDALSPVGESKAVKVLYKHGLTREQVIFPLASHFSFFLSWLVRVRR